MHSSAHLKHTARMSAIQKRAHLFISEKERCAAQHHINTHVSSLIHRLGAEIVAFYIGERHEPRLDECAEDMHQKGRILCLPCSAEHKDNSKAVFRRYAPGDTLLRTGKPAFMQPSPDKEIVHPDVIICPMLAFDREGRRLGQGGGYYDRAIALYMPRYTIGVAFAGMEHEGALPHEPHDINPSYIITENGCCTNPNSYTIYN